MRVNIGEILVRFGAETSGLIGGIRLAIGALGAFGMAAVATVAIVGGLAVVLGVKAVEAAGNFQQGLNRLVTGAGDVTDNMKTLGAGILSTSVATGILTSGASGLNAAMYLIISSGQRGAQALDTLKAAAQGAQIEQANMVDVTQILTTLQTDFGLHTYTATQYMNGLVAAVAHGKISLENLSTAMSPILPNAKELGVHFADVAAAMADMTNQGIPADQAATALRFVMQSMILPTKASTTAMKEWGLNSTAVAAEMKVSLPGAIQMYIDAAKRAGPEGSKPFIDALSNMMGGGQRAAKALFSLSQSMGMWRSDIAAVNAAMGLNNSAVAGWQLVQGSFNIKMDQARAAVAALGIVIGTAILPELSHLLDILMPVLASFSQWIIQSHVVENAMHSLVSAIGTVVSVGTSLVNFFRNNELAMSAMKGVLITVAIIIGAELVFSLYAAATAAWAFAAGLIAVMWPVYLVVAAIALVVIAFVHFYNTSAGFRSVIDAIVGALKTAGAAVLQFAGYLMAQVGPALQIAGNFFRQLWVVLQQGWAVIQQAAAALARLGMAIYSTVLPYVTMLAGILRGQFLPVWAQLMATWAAIQPLLTQLAGVFRMLWATVQQLAAIFMAQLMPTLRSTAAALSALWSVIGPSLLPGLKLLAMVIGGVLLVSLGLLVGVLTGVTGALARFLSGAIQVVQGVMQVFTGLAEFFSGIVSFIVDLFTGKWGKLAGDLAMIWQGIVNMLQGAMTAMIGIFNATFGIILGFVQGFASGVIGFFTTLYHELVGGSIVPDMCAGIIAAFSNMIARALALVAGFVSNLIGRFVSLRSQATAQVASLVSGVASTLSQLVGIAARAGQAMIAALVGQINAGVGWVAGAINNVVAAIGNVLPHSPAKEGPLRDLNKFGPAITHGLAAGIIAGSPEVRAAVNLMVQPIKGAMTAGVGIGTGTSTGASTTPDNRPIIIQIGQAEYRGFVQNLGRDLATTVVIQKGGMR